jgi:hypothetical protein
MHRDENTSKRLILKALRVVHARADSIVIDGPELPSEN